MSEQALGQFINEVVESEDLRNNIQGKSADEVVGIAGEMGMDVTAEEVSRLQAKDEELTDEQLENVAGGFLCWFFDCGDPAFQNDIKSSTKAGKDKLYNRKRLLARRAGISEVLVTDRAPGEIRQ